MKYVGVDIGGTNLKAGLADENGQLLAVQKMKVASITDQQSLAWTIVAMTQELAKSAGATEDLKRKDQLAWVGLMNACRAQADEIVKFELVYD